MNTPPDNELAVNQYKITDTGSEDSANESTSRHPLIRGAEIATLGFELGPFNEIARLAVLGASYAATKSPEISAIAYGTATMAIEGGAAVATADLLASPKGKKVITWTNAKLQKIGVPPTAKTNKPIKAGVAAVGGSSILLVVKHSEEPERTLRENIRYGLTTSAALAGMCALQGYAVAEGVNHPNPETIGAAAIAVGGVMTAANWLKNKTKRSDI
jgi:hypothetical protein